MFLWISEINAANSQDSFPLSEGGLFGDAFVHLDTLFQTTFKGCWSSVKFIGPKSNHQPDFKNTGYQFPLLTSSSGTALYWPWGFREKRTITSFDWSAHCYVFVCGFKKKNPPTCLFDVISWDCLLPLEFNSNSPVLKLLIFEVQVVGTVSLLYTQWNNLVNVSFMCHITE